MITVKKDKHFGMNKLRTYFADFPKEVKLFLLRCLVLFIVFQCYFLVIESNYRIINSVLTYKIAALSSDCLNLFHQTNAFRITPYFYSTRIEGELVNSQAFRILFENKYVLHIADSCNGLELLALYIGFIIAMPLRNLKRKIKYIVLGSIVIFSVNVLRCVGLVEIQMLLHRLFKFAHHYLFKMIIYGTIFFIWFLFMKTVKWEA